VPLPVKERWLETMFSVNLVKKRFYLPEEDRWITLRVAASTIKTINKNGIAAVLKEAKANGFIK